MADQHSADAFCGASPDRRHHDDEGLRTGDQGDGPVHAELLDQLAREEYYNSPRFVVGYQELQERWSRGWGRDGAGDWPQLPPPTPQHHPSTRKKSLLLPLPEISVCAPPGDVGGVGSFRGRHDRCWNSSTGSSPIGTPSPLPSAAPSPLTASPCVSATSSPRQRRMYQGRTSPCASSHDCVSSGSCCNGGAESPAEEARNDRASGGRVAGFLDALRQALLSLRRRPRPPPTTALEDQVVVLEAELESYKQLSTAKRRAADLLKHQLMEALYEQVSSQLEHDHRRQQLQQEMMAMEIQLHVLWASARRELRQLDTQLQREDGATAPAGLRTPLP